MAAAARNGLILVWEVSLYGDSLKVSKVDFSGVEVDYQLVTAMEWKKVI